MDAKKVVLISCSKAKLSAPCEARKLYSASNLFAKSLAYAELISSDIYIISAKYGLVRLDEIITPYDETLNDKTQDELAAWGEKVAGQLHALYDVSKTEFVILAGKNYHAPLQKHLPITTLPLRGLPMGKRLARLDALLATGNPEQASMCYRLHELFNAMLRFRWNTIDNIPFNSGIYIVFENGEKYHHMDRIVRVGTHRSDGRLRNRLKDHFVRENKDGSIFRKNIGRAILNKNNHSYLSAWNMNTSKADIVVQMGDKYNPEFQAKLEKQISQHIREHFSFVCFPVHSAAERLRLEEGIIATLNWADDFAASDEWGGRHSSERDIVNSGMWLKEGLEGTQLSESEFAAIETYCLGESYTKIQPNKSVPLSPAKANKAEIRTAEIVEYISDKLFLSKANGERSLIIVSGDIHKELGLVSRMPTVCGAMRKLIKDGDKIHYAPPKGNGATLRIEYFL